jgi:hypothetical protein
VVVLYREKVSPEELHPTEEKGKEKEDEPTARCRLDMKVRAPLPSRWRQALALWLRGF